MGTPEWAGSGRRIKVLVVDDDKPFLEVMEIVLGLKDYVAEARISQTGLEALQVCVGFQPDVVFVDSIMPAMDGNELGSRMRALLPGARLVSITGMSGKPAPEWADDHILKTGSIFDRMHEVLLGEQASPEPL